MERLILTTTTLLEASKTWITGALYLGAILTAVWVLERKVRKKSISINSDNSYTTVVQNHQTQCVSTVFSRERFQHAYYNNTEFQISLAKL